MVLMRCEVKTAAGLFLFVESTVLLWKHVACKDTTGKKAREVRATTKKKKNRKHTNQIPEGFQTDFQLRLFYINSTVCA